MLVKDLKVLNKWGVNMDSNGCYAGANAYVKKQRQQQEGGGSRGAETLSRGSHGGSGLMQQLLIRLDMPGPNDK